MLAKADVFVQNLKPGALAKLGFAIKRLRKDYPRLICCSISGYGESGPYAQRKAYDLLVQAESGLSSVTGGPEAPARVGVSVVDIAAGLNAYEAILEAIIKRARTGEGTEISVSMFDAMAEWMTIPLLNQEGGNPFKRIGLAHPTIAPYGVFKTRDGADILISIQNDREWRVLADKVLGDAALGTDPRFATNPQRIENRAETDGTVAGVFARYDVEPLMQKLAAADIAFARVNDSRCSPSIRICAAITVETPTGPASLPAPPAQRAEEPRSYGPVPALGAHTRDDQEGVRPLAASAGARNLIDHRFRGFAPAGASGGADDQHQRDHRQRQDHQQLEIVEIGDHRRLLGDDLVEHARGRGRC